MFCDEVARTWVKTSSEETRHQKVDERTNPNSREDDIVKSKLGSEVGVMPRRQLLSPHESRTQCVEENLECSKEDLPEDVVQKQQL